MRAETTIQRCSFTWHCSGQLTEASEDAEGDTEKEEFSLMEASEKKTWNIYKSPPAVFLFL